MWFGFGCCNDIRLDFFLVYCNFKIHLQDAQRSGHNNMIALISLVFRSIVCKTS